MEEQAQENAVVQSSIEDIINGMNSKKALCAFADRILGFRVSEELTVAKIREELIKIYNARADEAEKLNVQSTERMASDDDPQVKFKFLNLENPGADHEFASDGGRGLKKDANGVTGKVPYYHFYHGRVHTAPYSIMNMLNNLSVPFSKYETHPETGQVIGKIAGTKPRFSCQVLLDKEQIKMLSKSA